MIKRLDNDVATRIAAGEVIERPVSVAKELIENSIDAGAGTITLYLEQGGKSSLVIEDDGAGIAFDELPLALERYATSKISSLDDLERITTLGYRGEALASVAAVSRMEIRSRRATSGKGGLIRCEGGVITLHTDSPCAPGTRIQVDDLFFNFPARRKFLKASSAELRRIIQVVNDYALMHPEITFRLYSERKRVLEYAGVSTVEALLAKKWGDETIKYYSESSSGDDMARLWWNPMPDSRRVMITLFVNGRRVQDVTVRAAICGSDAAAYGEWLIMLTLPPEQLDVNIHPTKEEVRFRRSQDVFKIIYDNAHKIFNQKHGISSGVAPVGSSDNPFPLSGRAEYPPFDRSSNLFSLNPRRPVSAYEPTRVASPGVEFYPAGRGAMAPGGDIEVNLSLEPSAVKNYIGQTAQGYLLFDFPDGLAILDPHAAHERILYEEITESFKDRVISQTLAVPLEIPVALAAEAAAEAVELKQLGFLTENGNLIGVPALRGRGRLSPLEMLRSALRGIEVEQDPAKRDREVWWRIARLACRDAMKLGRKIERPEAIELLRKLERCETPYTCPHGRPTVFLLFDNKLEEWFERS